jgi:hypothetical protein
LCACLFAVAGCGVPAKNGPADTFGIDFSMPPEAGRKGAVVFLIDGLNGEIFERMLEQGELPVIKKYFVDCGLYAPRAVASIPSVTLANLTSIATGQFPGHHDVTGVNWFDRNRLVWRNYNTIAQKDALDGDYTTANIYEQFPDELTFSLFFQPHRGATKFYENALSAVLPFAFGYYEYVDRLSLYRFGEAMKIAREYRRFPAVTVVYLLAPDFRAYQSGVSGEAYRRAILHVDRQVGRVLGDMERAGMLKDVIIALTSDHSMTDVTRHFHYQQFLVREIGLKLGSNHWWENDPFEERLEDHRKITAVSYGSGDRYFALCLRKPIVKAGKAAGFEPWLMRPAAEDLRAYPTSKGLADLPALLIRQEAIDAVAYAVGKNRVRVLRREGEVEFRQEGGPGGKISFAAISGKDALGWEGKIPAELLAGAPATGRRWLKATVGTRYPDLPAQIVAYFRATRAGDLVAFASLGWDFNRAHRAGHGGLLPQDMCTPMLLAGPGVPHRRIETARTVDLMPMLLQLMGKPIPPGLDGQPLTADSGSQ